MAYASAISNEPGGQVMHDRLVERAKVVEEKLVDVLCATQIARAAHKIAEGTTAAEAIVVLSEDMDLIPAYKFAQELGVEISAASHSTVDTRPDSKWLLLTEGAWRLACGRPDGGDYGHMLRRRIAKICMNANTTMAFKVRAFARSERRAFLRHASGAQAVWNSVPAGMSLPVGSRHKLHVVGLDLDNVERAFPPTP